ncbi:MAG: long-chain fatty acid--CoA ligase, partial [Treponemataceae bacterium]|nr:long-chain fatty acid--CoA ligase [Treponemataceae bacterium]
EQDDVESFANESGRAYKTYTDLLRTTEVNHLIENEVGLRVNAKNGFKMYERINKVALLEKPFEVGVELSAKQEIMRYKINDLYAKEIKSLYK